MPSVAVNAPKTPVTKGSNGIAAATVPNVCKMPGPPAPFVPAPLPNIGRSSLSPKGYTKTVKVEGNPVAVRGASFGSQGDIASKGTGGGLLSANTHGPTKFIGPGSLDVKFEGKNVQLLGDPMFNNCGPSGSPPNSATLAGVLQGPAMPQLEKLGIREEAQKVCDAKCECDAEERTDKQNCIDEKLHAEDRVSHGHSNLKTEVQYNMGTDPPSAYTTQGSSDWTNPLGRGNRSFKSGHPIGGSRRPDVVVLEDATKPWTADNIKGIIECKWGKDKPTKGQIEAYEEIAGDEKKVIKMGDNEDDDIICKCE